MDLFRKKHFDLNKGTGLKKTLGALDLISLGVGAIIGTGIFVITGQAAAEHAGPALMISFVIAAIACILAALCYSELASTVTVSGSAYAYSYAAFGEVVGWLMGWTLVLEYGVAAASVASGWSAYVQGLLEGFGIHLPTAISGAFNLSQGQIIDLPAVLIIMAICLLLTQGARETARFNAIMVFVKIAVIIIFILVGAFYVKPDNWTPFMPFGFSGVMSGAAVVFFAYIGFDAVATAAEEVKNPQRNLPIGIIGSLIVCMIMYSLVAVVLTGMVPFTNLGVADPVAFALRFVGQDFVAGLISVGAIVGITTVLLVLLFSQTRLLFAISRDGLLPKFLSKVDEKKQTPVRSTWMVGIIIALLCGLLPLDQLASLTIIGTLFAFAVVSLGVIGLRKSRPDLKRGFSVPWVPFLPLLSAAFCVLLMLQLDGSTWGGFAVWILVGLGIYFFYGYRHSELGDKPSKK
ncbi:MULTISPECIES: amino acid permease [unclassified Paenibacillus]|uniref:amino acid permease n=1 Tax=unclassified Paenibacillus TaxID=185978 RepID=UPI00089A581E|nr:MULTISPECIES: amino acid permease [unclassified Paenibacillus]OMC68369.1 amino acid permease [Paenibacillus sp. FSL H7-0326]SDW63585.1 amino acid/polyamine/organocation transporter, APC superfamily [Paenibacillus sp. PDC88]